MRSAPCTWGATRNDSGSCTERGAARLATAAAREEPADPRRRLALSGDRLGPGHDRLDDGRVAPHRLQAEREHDVDGSCQAGRAVDDEGATPDGHAVRRDEREAVLGAQPDGFQPGSPEGLGAIEDLAAELGAPGSDEHLRDGRHVHEVRGTDRACLADDGMDARLEHRNEAVGDRRADPGAAAREAVDPDGDRRPHDIRRERPADRADVAPDDDLLVQAERPAVDTNVAHVAETGVQPVDQVGAIDGLVHDRPRIGDPRPCRRPQLQVGAPCDRAQVGEREGAVIDRDHPLDRRRRGHRDRIPGSHAVDTCIATTATSSRTHRRIAMSPVKRLAAGM